jgi:oligoendopeptidase F
MSTARNWLPADLRIDQWEDIQPYFEELLEYKIDNSAAFDHFLANLNELEAFIGEDVAWRYINMTRDTADKEREEKYLNFVKNIQPKLAPYDDKLNKKINSSSYKKALSTEKAYFIYFREIAKSIELYREENIVLNSELSELSQKYGAITGAMTVEHNGNELTLQQAGLMLQENDRALRKDIYELISERRHQAHTELDSLFNELVKKRHQVALNADFENYRDYKFESLGRFDYGVKDCLNFHQAIEEVVVPLQKELTIERSKKLKISPLKPYDLAVDPDGKEPLRPFKNANELLEKSIKCFETIDPYFGECLSIMKKESLLDLDSRKGKAPGGYNYPLAESGKPFIFMNASGSLRDLETMVHEGGHAIHSFLCHPLKLNAFKSTPSEVAELASMSMELISMDGWHLFFDNEEELKRAKISQLEGLISTLPWIATIDAFQHWLYTNPNHTQQERTDYWLEISKRFSSGLVDFSGYEAYKATAWQRQLHLYEVPFYYIEYGFAQLGAIALWKKYKENKTEGLTGYKNFMKLGYTETIPDIYKAAGISFDFSPAYVQSLFDFVKNELAILKK